MSGARKHLLRAKLVNKINFVKNSGLEFIILASASSPSALIYLVDVCLSKWNYSPSESCTVLGGSVIAPFAFYEVIIRQNTYLAILHKKNLRYSKSKIFHLMNFTFM